MKLQSPSQPTVDGKVMSTVCCRPVTITLNYEESTMDTSPSNTTGEENTSNIETVITEYTFAAYDSLHVPATATGTRLSKVQYQKDADGNLAGESSYITIPELSTAIFEDANLWTMLEPQVLAWLEGIQDSIVKAHHKSGYQVIQVSAIDIDAIIEKLESKGQGRLNRDKIFAWFDADMADSLAVAFADKLGISDSPSEEEMSRINTIVSTYRVKLGALAGANSKFMPDEVERIQKALRLTGVSESGLGARFYKRLETMLEPDAIVDSL